MKFFDRFRKKKPAVRVRAEPNSPKVEAPARTEKELATERGEPWVAVLNLEIDPNNLHNGAIELDWNDKFIANLVRAGYQKDAKDTDADIVDRWFTAVCRNVVLETYEQYEAMNPERDRMVKTRNIGDGYSEVS